jgi:hypothetical protein
MLANAAVKIADFPCVFAMLEGVLVAGRRSAPVAELLYGVIGGACPIF